MFYYGISLCVIFYMTYNILKGYLGDTMLMANTDNYLVKQIGNTIKFYRKSTYPDIKCMDFYTGITESDDKVRKIEAGKSMPDFDFLIKLSKQYQLPVDYFTMSGFKTPDSAVTILDDIHSLTKDMDLQSQYEFIQKLNMIKYQIFTNIDADDLQSVSINETDKKLRGILLKNARIKNKLSINELSELINRSISTLQRMEAGGGESSPYIWTKISRQFHIPMDLFLLNRIKKYNPNLQLVIDYLICDTFLGLSAEERSVMYSIAEHYFRKKFKP